MSWVNERVHSCQVIRKREQVTITTTLCIFTSNKRTNHLHRAKQVLVETLLTTIMIVKMQNTNSKERNKVKTLKNSTSCN